jgi:hypothetical protein
MNEMLTPKIQDRLEEANLSDCPVGELKRREALQ